MLIEKGSDRKVRTFFITNPAGILTVEENRKVFGR